MLHKIIYIYSLIIDFFDYINYFIYLNNLILKIDKNLTNSLLEFLYQNPIH